METVFVVSYLIQVPLAIYAAFFIPRRGELSQYMENGRQGAIVFGVLPCAFISVIMQLSFIGIYWLAVKQAESSEVRAQSRLGGTRSGPSPGGNPFGGGGLNPLDSGPKPSGQQDGSSGAQDSNPFS